MSFADKLNIDELINYYKKYYQDVYHTEPQTIVEDREWLLRVIDSLDSYLNIVERC